MLTSSVNLGQKLTSRVDRWGVTICGRLLTPNVRFDVGIASMKSAKTGQRSSTAKRSIANSVDEYLARVPEPARGTLKKIRGMIRSVVPAEATEAISYGIPNFEYKGWLAGYAAFANHRSFFPGALPRKLADELKRFPTSKGTIRFQVDKPLPTALMKKLVRARIAENELKDQKKRSK
jgi:uncharacterized protein YdhG (YjbR/CyaY superfamily)